MLEELTTTRSLCAAMIVLWLLSRAANNLRRWRWPVWPFLQGLAEPFAGQRESYARCV